MQLRRDDAAALLLSQFFVELAESVVYVLSEHFCINLGGIDVGVS